MALPGSFQNASEKDCWQTCSSCFRCANKTRYTKCGDCSGRHDPFGQMGPDHDDYCECTKGVLRWREKTNGRVLISRLKGDPFAGKTVTERETEDERDWDRYLQDTREKMDNPTWDPIKYV